MSEPARRRRVRLPSSLDWRTSVPVFVLALLVGCTAVFIRLTQEYEIGRLRDQQVADALWVEQTIRFQLARDEESLQLIANDLERGQLSPTELDARMLQLARSRHELVGVSWLPLGGALPGGDPTLVDRVALAALAARNGRPAYSAPYAIERGATRMDYLVPATKDGKAGVIVATFSLDRVLGEMIPWWFAQKNEVQLLDANGSVLAARAAAGKGKNIYVHTTLLNESNAALYLRTDSVRDKPGIFANALAGAVLLLSITLIWSLYALRKDMTRRAAAEAKLREEHAFRKAMDDSLETGVRARDLAGRLTYVNPAFCKMVGFAPGELVGRAPPMPYWLPDAIEDHERALNRTLAGASPRDGYETTFRRRDGTRMQVLIHEAKLIDASGEHTGWLSSVLDITERRRIEEVNRMQQEKLLSGARLATMGEMASTLSHELNQPLSAITSFATGCLNLMNDAKTRALSPASRQGVRHAIEAIHAQAARAGMIVKSVHNLVKKREHSRRRCDLAAIVRGVLPLIELQATNRAVRVVSTIDARPMQIDGDAIMLEQLLVNLARNAIEALQDVERGERRLEIDASIDDEDGGPSHVVVSVADNGPGIAEAHVAELFTPFFSTKAEGMGMGLSICRSVVEFHGGRIEHRVRVGGGAVFRFVLPLAAIEAEVVAVVREEVSA
jgi:two-component system sensor histidine kinase DctS